MYYIPKVFAEKMQKVPELLGHATRTKKLVELIAPGLTATKTELLVMGAFLHDIAKIYWPSSLHTKRNLTDSDWRIIRLHPVLGMSIVEELWPGAPQIVKTVVSCHHERPGGKGYPRGIVDVPTDVLIVAAAECYDAMTTKRLYRDGALTHQQAIQEIAKWCPRHIVYALERCCRQCIRDELMPKGEVKAWESGEKGAAGGCT